MKEKSESVSHSVYLTLCDPMDCNPLGSSIHRVFQARILECKTNKQKEYWSGLPFPSPGDLPDPGIEPGPPAFQADTLPLEPPVKPIPAKIHPFFFSFMYYLENMDHNAFPNHKIHFFNISFIYR